MFILNHGATLFYFIFFILVISQIYLHVVSPSCAFWGFALWLRSSVVTYVIPPLGGAQAYSVFCCSGEKVFLWQLMSIQQLIFWLATGGFLLSVSIHRRSESMWSTNTSTHPCLCDVVGTHDQSMCGGSRPFLVILQHWKNNQAVSQKGPKPTYHYKWSDRVPRLGAAYWGLVRCLVTGVVHANTPSGCSYFLSASQYTSRCNLYFGTTEDLWLKSVFSSVRLLYNIKFVTRYGVTWWGFHSRLDDVVTL